MGQGDEKMATFGEKFKKLRKSKSLTQEQLADLFYLNKSSISRYEKDKQMPEIELLQKFAEFFGVSMDYLLGKCDTFCNIEETTESSMDKEITQIIKDLGPDVTLHFHDLNGLTDEEKDDLKLFLQFLKSKRDKK